MRRIRITFAIIGLLLIVGLIVLWRSKGDAILASLVQASRGEIYPAAPKMPQAVSTSIDELLATYEQTLRERAPQVLVTLQPGLNDAEIDALEKEHHFKLTADLRALYRWRNGSALASNVTAFPDHHFVLLDRAIAERDEVLSQLKKQPPPQQKMNSALIGHRDAWLGLIVDYAGDGHFFDPDRSEAQGSFFFNFAEDGSYVFFPAFRNYVAAVIEGNASGVFGFGAGGSETKDFGKAQELFANKFGAANAR